MFAPGTLVIARHSLSLTRNFGRKPRNEPFVGDVEMNDIALVISLHTKERNDEEDEYLIITSTGLLGWHFMRNFQGLNDEIET